MTRLGRDSKAEEEKLESRKREDGGVLTALCWGEAAGGPTGAGAFSQC